MQRYLKTYARVFRIGEPAAKLHTARLLWLQGRQAKAATEVGEAVAVAQRLRMQPDLAEAQALAARIAGDDNS